MNFELLIPISLFIAIAYTIKAVVDARVRRTSARMDPEPASALAGGHDRAVHPAALEAEHGVERP